MKTENMPFPDLADKAPIDFLRKFVGVFESKGWLNYSFRVVHRDKKYRILCTEAEFIAQRINDNCEASWGFPCWVVCRVTPEQIMEEPDLPGFAPPELSVHDWLRCFVESDFKII